MNSPRSQHGIVLIYAILILSVVSVIGFGLSFLIVRELQLTSVSHFSTEAFYAAESGIERGLYTVRTNRLSAAETLSSTVTSIKAYSDSFTNGSSYKNNKTDVGGGGGTVGDILQDEVQQLDIYNIDNPSASVGVTQIDVSGTNTSQQDEWLEVSWFGWYLESGSFKLEAAQKRVVSHTELESTERIVLDSAGLPNLLGYRVRLRPLYDPVENVSVIAYDDAAPVPNQVTIPQSQIVIQANGKKGDVEQALTATVPWRIPLFGAYDYVLFAEEKITKTVLSGQPVYTSGVIQVEDNLTAACANCGACQGGASGWLGTCINTVSCGATPPTTCTAGTNSNFTLPIPSYVPGTTAGTDYYLSVRVNYAAPTGDQALQITVDSISSSSMLNIVDAYTAATSCTVPASFKLTNDPNRTIKFHVNGTAATTIDWYQLSTYKIFADCT